MSMEKIVYKTQEVIEMTGLNEKNLRMLRRQKFLHPTKIGRKWLYTAEDLKKFFNWAAGLEITNEKELLMRQSIKPFPK